MAAWYGVPPHAYQPQQAPAPPMQHHSMPWSATSAPPPPPGEQGYGYMSQPYHLPPQSDFYPPQQQQVHHQYPHPPQPAQPQFTYMYGQQDQVWQANNSWGHQQWPYPAQNASLSQEEVWAAKARAWAASKAVQEEPRPAPSAPQMYQEYMYQPQEPHPSLESQQHPSQQPLGQEAANASYNYQNTMISQGQNVHARVLSEHPPQSLGYDQPMQDTSPLMTAESVLESLEQKTAQGGGQPQPNDIQPVFGSGHVHDVSANYKLDTSILGSLGSDRLDHIPQVPPKQPPAASVYPQQPTHLLPQSQASPLSSQPRLTYSDKLSPSGFEHQQQQQQTSSSYIQPPAHQQPPAQVQHQPPKLPFQPQYQSTMAPERVEGEFGLPPVLQNWAPVGGPGMPFPPAMGAGSSQFDPLHTTHQAHGPWRPDGTGLQGLGFPSSAPFMAGSSPGVGPGAGTPGRPLFTPDNYIERPKKAAVPSWLREEIMKKKATGLAGNATGMLSSDESSRVNGGEPIIPLSQRAGISDKLRSSTPGLSEDEEEDQEEEIEAARNAAINLEIKRLLTEVLLKVTGDLFEEIAQEVLDEDDNENLQGKSSPDERSKVVMLASPSSPGATPPMSGRVFLAGVKNADTVDGDKDNESSDSDIAAGDVLGLGNYASDDETGGSKDYQEPLHGLEIKKENHESRPLDTSEHLQSEEKFSGHGGQVAGGPLQNMELVEKTKNARDIESSEDARSLVVKQELEEQSLQDVRKPQPQVQQEDNTLLVVKVHPDAQNSRSFVQNELGMSTTHGGLSMLKDDSMNLSVERSNSALKRERQHSDGGSSMLNDDSKNLSVERSNSGLKRERQHSDKDSERQHSDRDRLSSETRTTFNNRADALLEKVENKGSGVTVVMDKKKEEKGEGKARDLSSKERKREEKVKIRPEVSSKGKKSEERDERRKVKPETSGKEKSMDERTRDYKEAKSARGSDARVRDSSRDRRKEKDKEKLKARERESDRDRRKSEKREREGRSRRADAVDKKARHRSSSSSSSSGSSSNSDRSRGRSRARRSSRHTSTSSPGRSRKRRASRSRSRSRSPHVKHTHRRNVPSPSHNKSRKSGSKSPVHRRGHG